MKQEMFILKLPSFKLKKCEDCSMLFFESDGGCPHCRFLKGG